MTNNPWHWSEGPVDPSDEHIELRYGSARDGGWASWLPVARISPPVDNRFHVRLLLPPDHPDYQAIRDAMKQELDFYLLEKGEPDPWGYAQYHCTTTANVYSSIHWSYFPFGN